MTYGGTSEAERLRAVHERLSRCGCCGDPNAKVAVDDYYCKEHYVHCLNTPSFGPNGEDWDDDDPEYFAAVAQLDAEWEALA